ncbi:MAG: hypothetical protein PHI65_01655 [Firmicutes bacterium]|nr:hypothetical protein [Bacillota bacterium]
MEVLSLLCWNLQSKYNINWYLVFTPWESWMITVIERVDLPISSIFSLKEEFFFLFGSTYQLKKGVK